MGRRKTLAEELADLANPAPTREYDPEAEDAADAPALNDSDEELLGGGAGRPSRSAPERGLRLRGGIELEDTAYRGRTTTRAAAFGDEEEEGEGGAIGASGSEEEDEGSSGSDDEQEEEEGGSSDDGSDAPSEEDLGRASRRAGGARGGGSGGEDEDEDGGGGDSDSDGGARGALRDAAARLDGDELRALTSQLGGLAAEDDAALAALRTAGAREREKGRAVARQRRGYDRALELRIHLQRGLAAANRLPGPRARAEALELRPELRGGYARLCEAAHATLAALLALTDAMAEAAPAVGAAAGERGGALRARAKRAREGYDAAPSAAGGWAALEAQAAALAPFRDASVDRWHRRTQLASGAGALRSNMRALDQSVSAQVAAAMRDTERAVARTRLPLATRPRVLCEPPPPQAVAAAAAAAAAPPGALPAPASAPDADARDPETYDDGDFYGQLLREFLESAGTDAAAAAGADALRAGRGAKRRKAVDRRASKGRKLRYTVHEKLVNFMVPVASDPPPFAAQLFANLFGGGGRAAA